MARFGHEPNMTFCDGTTLIYTLNIVELLYIVYNSVVAGDERFQRHEARMTHRS